MAGEKGDLSNSDWLEDGVRTAIEENLGTVGRWRANEAGAWGFLASKAVLACRELLGRRLTESERRLVWSRLWQELQRSGGGDSSIPRE